jgi:Mitochondrial carrier protein
VRGRGDFRVSLEKKTFAQEKSQTLLMATYHSVFMSQFPIAAVSSSLDIAKKPPPTGLDLYARFAFAGAVCCSVTHGSLTPVDVVKTRIQLEPEVYNKVWALLVSIFLPFHALGTGNGPCISASNSS